MMANIIAHMSAFIATVGNSGARRGLTNAEGGSCDVMERSRSFED